MIGFRCICGARQIKKGAWALLFVIGVSSCGGGGGGGDGGQSATNDATAQETPSAMPLPPTPQAMAHSAAIDTSTAGSNRPLLISEVATSYYSNDVTWLEVHNPSRSAMRLSDYALRSSSVDLDTGAVTYAPLDFSLPDVVVPPNGYLVIASKPYEQLRDGAQMVYVKNGNLVPYWNANGSIELLHDGVTVDFVRFGTSTAAPKTVSEWTGRNVAALPSSANEHGKAIVRLKSSGMADTNTAADWVLVNFATPAGMNDVAPGVIDSDLDGIPDTAKKSGGTYAGLDLHAMGARPGRRDIFMEIDAMSSSDVGITPRREALEKMQGAFTARGIALHIDAGALYTAGFDPAQFNLGGGNVVAFSPCIELDTLGDRELPRAGCASFQEYKNANFDVRRRLIFHYALFANSLNTDGSGGPSGIAEMYGNDLIVTLGGYDFSTATDTGRNVLINLQASTLMHEFGHNLGLRHGGVDDSNYKPNHYSVMNYMYQFAGLSSTPSSVHAAERYYLANGLKGKTFCGLMENSPCTDAFRMDYSDGSGAEIDETKLSEAANIGRGSVGGAYADWDDNDTLTLSAFGRNVNPLDGFGRSVLRDYDEWSNLSISFARGFSGSSSGRSLKDKPARVNPMSDMHPHHKVDEPPLPHALHRVIRESCTVRR